MTFTTHYRSWKTSTTKVPLLGSRSRAVLRWWNRPLNPNLRTVQSYTKTLKRMSTVHQLLPCLPTDMWNLWAPSRLLALKRLTISSSKLPVSWKNNSSSRFKHRKSNKPERLHEPVLRKTSTFQSTFPFLFRRKIERSSLTKSRVTSTPKISWLTSPISTGFLLGVR